MTRITFVIDDDLDKKVRTQISKNGGKKGSLSKTIEEALMLWLKEQKKTKKVKKDSDQSTHL